MLRTVPDGSTSGGITWKKSCAPFIHRTSSTALTEGDLHSSDVRVRVFRECRAWQIPKKSVSARPLVNPTCHRRQPGGTPTGKSRQPGSATLKEDGGLIVCFQGIEWTHVAPKDAGRKACAGVIELLNNGIRLEK